MVAQKISIISGRLSSQKRTLMLISLLSLIIWAGLYPQRFVSLWLTSDQQGRIFFDLGYYQQAAKSFQNPLWKGISFYAAEEFETAATLFSQYSDENGLLAQGNALAHSRNYVDAMIAYNQLLATYPTNTNVTANMVIVQALIDANQRLSESQRAEGDDNIASEDETGPRSSGGDERVQVDIQPKEQLSADQLLQDPALTEMWMRQVQKDPSRFLRMKFYMQLEQQQAGDDEPNGNGGVEP